MTDRLDDVYAHIDENFDRYIEEIRAYVRVKGVSVTGEGIQESAEYTADLIRSIGGGATAEVVQLEGGHPSVFGRVDSNRKDAKTLIQTSLYDVVAAEDVENWIADPFSGDIMDSNDHPEVGWDVCAGPVIVSRGVGNQRGPNLAFMQAMRSMIEVMGDLPANVVFAVDGEEEISSPHWMDFLDKKREDFLQADAAIVYGCQQDPMGNHTIRLGFRGMGTIRLVVESGEWGGSLDGSDIGPGDGIRVDAPALVLVHALASVIDQNGVCSVDGFFDDVPPPTPAEEELYAKMAAGFDEQASFDQLNVRSYRKHKPAVELYVDYAQQPSFNIGGLQSGQQGELHTSMVPMKAVARLDARLVPNQTQERFVEQLRAHLDRRGFEMVQIELLAGYAPAKTDPNDPLAQAAMRATERFGVPMQVWPVGSAGHPITAFAREPFNLPIMYCGLGFRWHSHIPNEWASVEGLRANMKYAAALVWEFANSQ